MDFVMHRRWRPAGGPSGSLPEVSGAQHKPKDKNYKPKSIDHAVENEDGIPQPRCLGGGSLAEQSLGTTINTHAFPDRTMRGKHYTGRWMDKTDR